MDAPTNPMVITSLLTFAEPLGPRELEAFVEQRLLPNERFRQRLVPGSHLHGARWELDPAFDLSSHLHHVALARPGDDRELERMAGEVMSSPLDARKPLWDLRLVDGYAGGSALIVRLHHAVADGMALVHLLSSITAGDTEDTVAATPKAKRRPPDLITRAGHATAALGRLLLLPRDPRTSLKGALGTVKRAAWSRAIPLATLKAIARADEAKVNDVFATVVAGGLRRYLAVRGELRSGLEVRSVVPVDLRAGDDASLGNRFGLVFLGLPLGIESPRERLREIARRSSALKESEEAVVTFAIIQSMALTGDTIDDLVVSIFEAKATLVLTSVPGPLQHVTMAGQRVRSMAFWVPQAGRLGLGVGIFSYAGEARIAVVTDANLVAEPSEVIAGIETELDMLSG